VFDRALTKLQETDAAELKHHPALADILEKYEIQLID
jgi:hypothetical protein